MKMRTLMTWLAPGVVMAGCGADDGSTTSSQAGAGAGAGTGAGAGAGGAVTTRGGAGGSDHPDDGSGGAAGSPGSSLDDVPSIIRDYIRSDAFTELVIEVDYVSGFEPRPEVARQIETGLGELLDKPDGVRVVVDGEIPSRGSDHEWSSEELRQLAEDTFDLAVADGAVKMHAMFIDGRDAEPDRTLLGLAWNNRHMVIWKQTLESSCSGLLGLTGFCPAAETTIWTHEAGHVLGLVNAGLPMVSDHEDPEHQSHDADPGCVMYWAYDGESLLDTLQERFLGGSEKALGFCDASVADIAAIRDAAD